MVGTLPEPELEADATPESRAAALAARIQGFRQDTRGQRMRIAEEAQHRFGRRISWGAQCGDQRILFTTVSVPAMTRLRMPERAVLGYGGGALVAVAVLGYLVYRRRRATLSNAAAEETAADASRDTLTSGNPRR